MRIKSGVRCFTIYTLLFLCTTAVARASNLPARAEGFIGEIRYSILTEKEFHDLYGKEWVLMDGRNILGSDLQKEFGWNKIPDARGVFLRCKNHGRDCHKGNPDGDLKLGAYQADELKSHQHFVDSGKVKNDKKKKKSFNTGTFSSARIGNEANERVSSRTGGDETRPRSITVNAFIKINHTLENALENNFDVILDEVKQLPAHFAKHPDFLKILETYIANAVEARIKDNTSQQTQLK